MTLFQRLSLFKNKSLSKKAVLTISLCIILISTGCERMFGKRVENGIFGYVQNEDGPVSEAVVRLQASETYTLTNEHGYFIIEELPSSDSVIVTAWSEGHYIGWFETAPSSQPIVIQLSEYSTADNLNYDWDPSKKGLGSLGCAECHPAYDEWINDAHSQSAVNERFLTMYSGTDTSGNQSPPTEYGYNPDYGNYTLLPDKDKPYYGPGYKLDFPQSGGNCSTCHVPSQAAYPGKEYTSDPSEAEGIELEGIFCDFCHKINDITINPKTNLPYENMPGILSIELLRPEEGDEDLFLGNFDDVVGPDSYLPIYEESKYCAACHFGTFWDTVIYNSYGEWLDSRYRDPETGQTCQQCHMPSVEYEYFVYADKGGVKRNPEKIRDHDMTTFMVEELMQNAVSLSANATVENGLINLSVEVINDLTGHAVPTDYPLRQMILLIEAVDGSGNTLLQTSGEVIPFYGGEGDPEQGYYAGLPGKIYMKVLQEIWTELYPSGSYWNPTRILGDNRLMPFEADRTIYSFQMGDAESAAIHVQLIYRRATKELMDQKSWNFPDILMEEIQFQVDQ